MPRFSASGASEPPTAVALAAADPPPGAPASRDAVLREQLPGLEPERTIDDWGRSERIAGLADRTVLEFLYHYWFRVEVEGLEHVPTRGGALLLANRAGLLPLDGAMIAKAVRDRPRSGRPVHIAAEQTFAGLPGLGVAVTKLGGVRAHPANLHRLLFDEEQLVLAFPEGRVAASKPLRWRYRLRGFEAAGVVAAAARAAVPIVPVAVVGAEEALPSLGALGALGPVGRALRLPLTAGVPLPAKFHVRFLEPVRAPQAPDTAAAVRALIQENVFEMAARRRSVWLG